MCRHNTGSSLELGSMMYTVAPFILSTAKLNTKINDFLCCFRSLRSSRTRGREERFLTLRTRWRRGVHWPTPQTHGADCAVVYQTTPTRMGCITGDDTARDATCFMEDVWTRQTSPTGINQWPPPNIPQNSRRWIDRRCVFLSCNIFFNWIISDAIFLFFQSHFNWISAGNLRQKM